jgi:hypothetical protein
MRHVRMLLLCMAAVLAIGALVASSASAMTCTGQRKSYGGECETEKEHAEFQAFANCPFHEATPYGETQACVFARTTAKEHWKSRKVKEEWETTYGRKPPELRSEFKAGNVTVLLKEPITLKGGWSENEETGELYWIGARGTESIQAVAQPGPSLAKDVDKALLSGSELERYEFAISNRETKVTATVELAGPASGIHLNEGNLLGETGTAFGFPVKVKLTNAFLGNSCYVGSNANPITVDFSTGESGELHGKAAGAIYTSFPGTYITIETDTLVSTAFSAPGVEGCGIEGGADEAVNTALGLPSPTGNIAVINGTLKQTGAEEGELGLKGEA